MKIIKVKVEKNGELLFYSEEFTGCYLTEENKKQLDNNLKSNLKEAKFAIEFPNTIKVAEGERYVKPTYFKKGKKLVYNGVIFDTNSIFNSNYKLTNKNISQIKHILKLKKEFLFDELDDIEENIDSLEKKMALYEISHIYIYMFLNEQDCSSFKYMLSHQTSYIDSADLNKVNTTFLKGEFTSKNLAYLENNAFLYEEIKEICCNASRYLSTFRIRKNNVNLLKLFLEIKIADNSSDYELKKAFNHSKIITRYIENATILKEIFLDNYVSKIEKEKIENSYNVKLEDIYTNRVPFSEVSTLINEMANKNVLTNIEINCSVY